MSSRQRVVTALGVMTLLAVSPGLVAVGQPQRPAPAPAAAMPPAGPVLDRYCVTCHNQKLKTAGLTLDTFDVSRVGEHADVWEKVLRRLKAADMPPPGVPRPDQATYKGVASWLETELDRAAVAAPNPGALPAFQRLTRTEYQNAIRDLLGLSALPKGMDIELLLPADSSSSGFDTFKDLLYVSSTQLEQYLSAARKISRLAVGDPSIPPFVDIYSSPTQLPQDVQVDGAPLGTRGGLVIRTHLPQDGEYEFHIELANAPREPHQLEVSVDGERVQLFTADVPPKIVVESAETSLAKTGTVKFENDLEAISRKEYLKKGFNTVVSLKAGDREIVVSFLKRTSALVESEVRPLLRNRGSQPAVASVTIKGPYNASGAGETESRRRIFVCRPAGAADESRCARQIVSALARRAYRRPVTDADLREPLLSYDGGRAEGGFELGIERALERLLVSPQFVFRIERDPKSLAPGTLYRISDLELASRLSFFIWSSIPDDELLEVAARGALKDARVLEQQVRRMLADPRAEALVTNFAAQWLFLRDVKAKNPNDKMFADFDEGLRRALERETQLFVNSVLREEDRSVLALLTANYTFLNERLAKHYGVPNVYGVDFRRVTLGDDSPRRGLLGQGSILTLSSHASRTSPVLRGKYILDNLLATPPPPPPPNVPALVANATDGKPLSMREAMVLHRKNPVCASCHSRMDPLGFALENFDAIGRYRTRGESGAPIDASASLPDGTTFEGVGGLRQLLVSRSDLFVMGLTEKLLAYAVGRKVAQHDAPAIRQMVRLAGPDYRFSSIVLGLVRSVPFQMRRSGAPAAVSVAAR